MTAPVEPVDPFDQANQRVRDAAKWLIASAAAVGATLIAGSQLSNIGLLPFGWPTSVANARLWLAVLGAVLGLAAVVFAIWSAVRILLPRYVLIGDLVTAWVDRRHPLWPVVAFFQAHPKYLQGFATPAELVERRTATIATYERGGDATVEAEIRDLDARIVAIEDMATHEALNDAFRAALRRMVGAVSVAALGIVLFAWASNPPPATPSADLRNARLTGAFLRDADLRDAKLDGADLSGADLTGADLTGASIAGVTWSRTTCPDGSVSDDVGGTCAGHLAP
ncbi:pentapeptide repeat-containing protein [Asanoa sp. WMMD1127]|uniref:pentapeptide repeat-containing protein n=1 Tax=Asanoa sp. WMMD1127 TaxID=3016107 RepID=UPI0024165D18|nr:pentapeptide repeat-containing protein [Asanoa sp. WMMD1127]MDG4821535.1 pentapeptide repeat-containing protein [Asanoa sp. WMMD1127]